MYSEIQVKTVTLSRAQPYSQSPLCGLVPITGLKDLIPSIPLSPLLTLIPGKEVTEGHIHREMLFVPLSSVTNFLLPNPLQH